MITEIRKRLQHQKHSANDAKHFFKTGVGEYSEHDQFWLFDTSRGNHIAHAF